jgi:hypothetical protein
VRLQSKRAMVARGRVGRDQFAKPRRERTGLAQNLLCEAARCCVAWGRKANMCQIFEYSAPAACIVGQNLLPSVRLSLLLVLVGAKMILKEARSFWPRRTPKPRPRPGNVIPIRSPCTLP